MVDYGDDWLTRLSAHFAAQLHLVYITSMVGVVLAFAALRRNDGARLRLAAVVTAITALLPAACLLVTEAIMVTRGGNAGGDWMQIVGQWLHFTASQCRLAMTVVALFVHVYAVMVQWRLTKCWDVATARKAQ